MNNKKQSCISETYFWRDLGQFDLLRLRLLPELIARRSRQKTLRFWSAGCASGEEAYSLAILLDSLLPNREDWNILILGSDINPAVLAKARQARYGQWSFRLAPPDFQRHYFRQQGSDWILDEPFRSMVSFRDFDLVTQPFPDGELRDMDLILCRNVFIYFDIDDVSAVANKLAATLSEGGYLMTAHAELGGVKLHQMRSRLYTESVVYQRVGPLPVRSSKLVGFEPSYAANSEATAPAHIETPPASLTAATKPAPSAATKLTQPEDQLTLARHYADRAEYDRAELICRQILTLTPLAAAPHFLLAQLAQLKGDFHAAETLLHKTLYLDPDCVAAALELAALYERSGNPARAKNSRTAALDIVRKLPADAAIEPYDLTAAEIAQWLAQ